MMSLLHLVMYSVVKWHQWLCVEKATVTWTSAFSTQHLQGWPDWQPEGHHHQHCHRQDYCHWTTRKHSRRSDGTTDPCKWKRTASNLSLLSHSQISNFTQFKITLIVTLTSCEYWHWLCDTVGDWWIVAEFADVKQFLPAHMCTAAHTVWLHGDCMKTVAWNLQGKSQYEQEGKNICTQYETTDIPKVWQLDVHQWGGVTPVGEGVLTPLYPCYHLEKSLLRAFIHFECLKSSSFLGIQR